ncbi:hypothetical protein AB1N83_009818 [Pleurotus pulmonarius]
MEGVLQGCISTSADLRRRLVSLLTCLITIKHQRICSLSYSLCRSNVLLELLFGEEIGRLGQPGSSRRCIKALILWSEFPQQCWSLLPASTRYTSPLRAVLFTPNSFLKLSTSTMQFTIKFAALAFLAQVAVIAAFPLEQGYDNDLEARGPTKRPSQQECEAACTLAGFQGQAWNQPVQQARPAVRPAPRIKVGKRGPTKRPTQQESQQARPAVRPAPRIKVGKRESEELEARGPTKRPTQQESQQARPAVRPAPRIKAGKRDTEDLEARGPTKRPTQQECEVACTLAGFQGQAWNQCVSQCVAGNYPTPPPSPQNRPVQQARPAVRPAPRVKVGKRDFEDLEARGPTKRPTQQECEAACTLAGFQGQAWNQPVQQAKPAVRPAPRVKVGKRETEGGDEE